MKKMLLLCAVLVATALNFDASAQKNKKEKAPPKTIAELVVEMENTKSTGDRQIDAFVVSSVELARKFKAMSDEWQNIKIEVTDIEDQGDGVTTAVTITDAEGNPRTKEAVKEANTERALNLVSMGIEATALGLTGTNLVSNLVNNPIRALSMAFAIKQLKLCVEALAALGREIPVFAQNVKTQNELIEQSKQI